MGIIRKQSIYSSIFSYLGFIIGAVNMFVLFKMSLTLEEIGLTRLLLDLGILFAAVSTFGTIPVTIKFFPFYDTYLAKRKNDLPALTFFTCLAGCAIVVVALVVCKAYIIRKFGANSPLFVTHYNLLYPLTVTIALFSLFEAYAWNIRKTTVSNFLREVAFRVIVSLLLILLAVKCITLETFLSLYAYIYLPAVLLLLLFLVKSGHFPINFSISNVTRRLRSKMLAFGIFIFSGSLLNVLSRTIDVVLLASQSTGGLKDAAVFTYASYMISIMEVPQRSIVAIGTPIIANAWKNKNRGLILELYQKTSLNLLIIGFAIWGVLFLNMHNAVIFLGPLFKPMTEIFVIMGAAKLIDLGTGLNSQILLLSKFWKVDFITNMLFVALSLPLNYFLIGKYNIYGAAYANFIALTTFNGIRFLYIFKLFKLQPFTWKTFHVLVIAVLCIGLVYLIPELTNLYLDTALRTIIFGSAFASAVLFFKVSPDMTALYRMTLQKLTNR